MTTRSRTRPDALTRQRIVGAAIGILDDGGVDALTFRALAAELATGAGAIYHHVANKAALLEAAAADVMEGALDGPDDLDSVHEVRALALAVFDAIRAHPWLGTQLVAAPWQRAVLELFDRVGTELAAIGVAEHSQFDAASAVVHHVLGVASQYDAGTRLGTTAMSRPEFLESAATPLTSDGSGRYPFLTRMRSDLAEHSDRAQFEAGIGIILAGIDALR